MEFTGKLIQEKKHTTKEKGSRADLRLKTAYITDNLSDSQSQKIKQRLINPKSKKQYPRDVNNVIHIYIISV